jgi:hypothetical protein
MRHDLGWKRLSEPKKRAATVSERGSLDDVRLDDALAYYTFFSSLGYLPNEKLGLLSRIRKIPQKLINNDKF